MSRVPPQDSQHPAPRAQNHIRYLRLIDSLITYGCDPLKSSNHNVSELHISRMVLQADVAFT
jgi:hypothetical protein